MVTIFFQHSLNKDVSCVCPFQKTSWDSIEKLKIRQYHHGWRKIVNILTQYGHQLFGSQEIQEGSKDEKIKVMYERSTSTSINNLFKMSFFAFVQISVIKDMVREDVVMFQNIWKETNEEHSQTSLFTIKRYLKHCEDIDMGLVNVHWGVPQDSNVITSLP